MKVLLAEEWLSQPGAQDLVVEFGPPELTSDYDDCPEPNPATPPTYPGITYKTFSSGVPPTLPILLDEYDPTGPGPYPVMVLVHGGGWWRGCRTTLQPVAWEGSGRGDPYGLPQYFIVLSIDYRLACDPDDPNLVGSPIRYLCGWNYVRTDPATSSRGTAIHDVQDAIRWVTNVWQNLPGRPAWDGRLFVLGTSAGGTLAYQALAPSPTVGGAVDVDGVASWSGHHEFDIMGNGFYPCHPSQSGAPEDCAEGINQYLGCNTSVYPDSACIDPGGPPPYEEYTDASTITWYLNKSTLAPPIFANGGLDGDPEVVALQSVIDFANSLLGQLWVEDEDFMDCIIGPNAHGRGLRGWPCMDDGPQDKVWVRTSSWLDGLP